MNDLILLNYIIFAALFTLLLLELAGAIISILDTDLYKRKALVYLAPLWEITGTLSVFYLVNLVATYPGLLPTIDYLYLAPILAAAVFLIARDTYLAYSELSLEKRENRKHARAYGILTILTMFLIITALSSSVSGGGVNPTQPSVNLISLLFNKFNILIFAAIIALASSCGMIFFGLKYPKTLAILATSSALLLLAALKLHAPYILTGMANSPAYLTPILVLLVLLSAAYLTGSRYTKYLVLPFLFIGILTFEFFQYPYLFGGATNLGNFTATQPTAEYIILFTLAGAVFLGVALGLFFYVHHSKRRRTKAIYPKT